MVSYVRCSFGVSYVEHFCVYDRSGYACHRVVVCVYPVTFIPNRLSLVAKRWSITHFRGTGRPGHIVYSRFALLLVRCIAMELCGVCIVGIGGCSIQDTSPWDFLGCRKFERCWMFSQAS